MRVRNLTRNTVLCTSAERADSFFTRLRGLMFRPALPPGGGLLLVPEHSIHTFFMRFPIDVLYLDGGNRVLRLDESVAPNRVGPFVRGCAAVLEVPPSTIRQSETTIGDRLLFEVT